MKYNQVKFLILLFSLGIVGEWLLRDQFRPNDAGQIQVPADVVSISPQADLTSLIHYLNEGLFDKAVSAAEHLLSSGGDRSVEVNHLIETTASALVRQQRFLQAVYLLEKYYSKFNPTLHGLILLARCYSGTEEYRQQVSTLFQAMLLAGTEAEEQQLRSLLEKAISRYSRFLVTKNRWGDLDLFYQELISEEPENPDHYLQLALLRIRVGDLDGALDPLTRIENDPLFGEQAQQLIEKVQRKSELVPIATAEIPLLAHGSQYIVKARLDNYRDLHLLIDTGAAITVIEPQLLLELGYNLGGDVQYFNTANGTIQAPMVDVEDLSLGSIAIKELPVAAVNLNMSRDVDGLLGMNFLRHYQFRIDQNGKVLYLNPMTPSFE